MVCKKDPDSYKINYNWKLKAREMTLNRIFRYVKFYDIFAKYHIFKKIHVYINTYKICRSLCAYVLN